MPESTTDCPIAGTRSQSVFEKPATRLRRAQTTTGGVVGPPGYNTGIRTNLRLA